MPIFTSAILESSRSPTNPESGVRLLDLSYPAGASINDGIEPALCSLRYPSVDPSVDEAVCRLLVKDSHSFMAKVEIESAYRIVPVHPDIEFCLGCSGKTSLYDTALPFRLHSAPKIFNAMADRCCPLDSSTM